ncbi:siphovirus Gp157 family protein [Lentilactobacillus sp. SPB1-3]|uniref:Siphovirus Gp157 family protein n=1 Tax=Lentilactobacillus terminaliae TaxID=3003483 RepID=A0ACD5DDB8_9LACO|nr:siphovirus Gp157 family protein [Lentilactobacillus sp. SPB1-3]MCZ0978056.1 siphovirus Gp157 family protein [Lentilactobacillus sp. SPB1-3]
MQTSLYDLTQAINDLKSRDDLELEIIKDTLDSLQDTRDQKLDNISNWIDDLQKDVDWDIKKAKEYQDDKKHKQNKIDSLKRYVSDVMTDAGISNLQTDNHKLGFGRLSYHVEVPDLTKLPVDYINSKTVYTANKAKIQADIKAGKEITGASLEGNRKLKIL